MDRGSDLFLSSLFVYVPCLFCLDCTLHIVKCCKVTVSIYLAVLIDDFWIDFGHLGVVKQAEKHIIAL